MKPNRKFFNRPKSFWAAVRTVSQKLGYTVRKKGQVRVPTVTEIKKTFESLNLATDVVEKNEKPTKITKDLIAYYEYRADVLNNFVEPRLMDANRAKTEFEALFRELQPSPRSTPMNKQKGEKRAYAYLTGIVNMLIEANAEGLPCVYDPRALTTITVDDAPLRTLARRVDGAFPSVINPTVIWEIKEYYYTTTFGSRVADGVYETLLDGMELEELYEHEKIKVLHYLMIDAHYTWWDCGKSYLCRIVDMLHMGYVDEVLFGYEIIERLPKLVKEWVALEKRKRH